MWGSRALGSPAGRSAAMLHTMAGAKGEASVQELDRSQRAIARRSAEARATIPDLDLTVEVDMRACRALGQQFPCPITALLVWASALGLRQLPRVNGAYREGRLELYPRVNVGVVVASGEAYTIPTVFDADRKSLRELAGEIARLAARARDGELSPPELGGATFTVSNLGPWGIASSTPLIVAPQAAALSAGAIRATPMIRDGAIVPGHAMTLTLACDHRILHSAQAAMFLARIKALLERGAPTPQGAAASETLP